MWFFIGISTFSLCSGLLIGSSQTPILGVVFTGIISLIVPILGYFNREKINNLEQKTLLLLTKFIGKSIFMFSICLIMGIFLGLKYRVYTINTYEENKNNQQFPWLNSQFPSTTQRAIDWIIIKKYLNGLGYSDKNIQVLYQKSLKDSTIIVGDLINEYRSKQLFARYLRDNLDKGSNSLVENSESTSYNSSQSYNPGLAIESK